MLSVIIPVYNVAPYLQKCLDSVLIQRCNEMEIILVDDGSTDRSGSICDDYVARDSRVRVIHQSNAGSGEARNMCISVARGEYLTFLDSDDWWGLDYVPAMLSAMEDADIAVCDLVFVDTDEYGKKSERISAIRLPEGRAVMVSDDLDIINKARTYLCGKIFKAELFRRSGLRQETMAINDLQLVCPLVAMSDKIRRVAKPLYYYLRGRDGNTVTSFKAMFSFADALASLRRNFDNMGLSNKYAQPLRKLYYSQVRFALQKGRKLAVDADKQFEYNKLQQLMCGLLDAYWPEHPHIIEHTFACADERILKGLQNLVISEEQIVSGSDADYYICAENENIDSSCRTVITVNLSSVLEDEALYWDIADQILFALPGGGTQDV